MVSISSAAPEGQAAPSHTDHHILIKDDVLNMKDEVNSLVFTLYRYVTVVLLEQMHLNALKRANNGKLLEFFW